MLQMTGSGSIDESHRKSYARSEATTKMVHEDSSTILGETSSNMCDTPQPNHEQQHQYWPHHTPGGRTENGEDSPHSSVDTDRASDSHVSSVDNEEGI